MDIEALKARLVIDEALKLHPYRDTVGKLTIGVGRNIEDIGISKEEAMVLLDNDISRVMAELDRYLPWWRQLDGPRMAVLANMAFNLGIYKLLPFHNMLAALQAGDYAKASQEMLNSKWAEQVGDRAKRLAETMQASSSSGS